MISRFTNEPSEARAALLQVYYRRHPVLGDAFRDSRKTSQRMAEGRQVSSKHTASSTRRSSAQHRRKDAKQAGRKGPDVSKASSREPSRRMRIQPVQLPSPGPSEPCEPYDHLSQYEVPVDCGFPKCEIDQDEWFHLQPQTPTRIHLSTQCQMDSTSYLPLTPPLTPASRSRPTLLSPLSFNITPLPLHNGQDATALAGERWPPGRDAGMDAEIEELFNAYIHTDSYHPDTELSL